MSYCDILLPIYNGLHVVKACIASVLKHSQDIDYQLYLLNDASDTTTTAYLEHIVAQYAHISLHNNEHNLGFVQNCNRGFAMSKAPYVLILNSDVITTPNWLANLLACMEADKRIATVNPLCNNADNIDLPMAMGANFYGMNALLQQQPDAGCVDVVTGVGFCLLIRRQALEQVGVFDSVYGRGYCEESDLCMRLTTNGWRTVVAENVYVYHQGKVSFSDSLARYLHNRRIFDQRWKKEYYRQFRAYQHVAPLQKVRQQFALAQRWHPTPILWTTYRALLQQWQQRNVFGLGLAALRGLRQLPQAKLGKPTAASVQRVTRPQRLRITYVLNKIVVAGGVLAVVQLVNKLILQGIEARIVALFADPEIKNWQLFTAPIIFANPRTLIDNFPATDIVVATHWLTAYWVAEVMKTGQAKQAVYYLQDYEAWFFPENQPSARAKVQKTYTFIEHKITTSTWLHDLLNNDGYASHTIPIGIDLDVFYPRDALKKDTPVILAMARPGTAWRGFNILLPALSQIKQQRPDVEIVLFGDNQLFKQRIPFEYSDKGVITHTSCLAELYSQADVFIDASHYQGFGRLALEAMACGTACVLTDAGGVNEYARHEQNCLLVPPRQPEAISAAVLHLLTDVDLRQRLTQSAWKTVKDYAVEVEIQRTLDYFAALGFESTPVT